MDWCRLPVSCAVSVKAFPTAASARQTASGSGRGSVRCWLLALFGPVAVRVKAAPVVPGFVASVAGGDASRGSTAPRRSRARPSTARGALPCAAPGEARDARCPQCEIGFVLAVSDTHPGQGKDHKHADGWQSDSGQRRQRNGYRGVGEGRREKRPHTHRNGAIGRWRCHPGQRCRRAESGPPERCNPGFLATFWTPGPVLFRRQLRMRRWRHNCRWSAGHRHMAPPRRCR